MYLREMGYEGDDWIYLAQDLAVVDTNECSNSIKGRGVNSGDYY